MAREDDPDLSDLMTITEAARAVRMRRVAAHHIAVSAGIAVRWGGTDRHPRLKVRLRDLKRAILDRRYVPPQAPRRQAARPPAAARRATHPDVRC